MLTIGRKPRIDWMLFQKIFLLKILRLIYLFFSFI
jgi:hypothetical protein